MPKETRKGMSYKKPSSHGNSLRLQEKHRRRKMMHKINIIIAASIIITVILASYGVYQYYEGQKPPQIGGSSNSGSSSNIAPNFSLTDINGTIVSLSKYKGQVLGIHFMAVGCHGDINPINEYELTQLNNTCDDVCNKADATFLTVAVATCENSQLDLLRLNYGVSWILGNDYDNGVLEIVNSYVPFQIGDGTIILVDKDFKIAEVYNQGVSSDTLVSKINQLSGA